MNFCYLATNEDYVCDQSVNNGKTSFSIWFASLKNENSCFVNRLICLPWQLWIFFESWIITVNDNCNKSSKVYNVYTFNIPKDLIKHLPVSFTQKERLKTVNKGWKWKHKGSYLRVNNANCPWLAKVLIVLFYVLTRTPSATLF